MERMIDTCSFCVHERRYHITDKNTHVTRCISCKEKNKACTNYVGPIGGIQS